MGGAGEIIVISLSALHISYSYQADGNGKKLMVFFKDREESVIGHWASYRLVSLIGYPKIVLTTHKPHKPINRYKLVYSRKFIYNNNNYYYYV